MIPAKMKFAFFLILLLAVNVFFVFPDWVVFKDRSNSYTISFPHAPLESSQQINSAVGLLDLNIAMHEVGNAPDDNMVYMAIYSDYPDTLVNSDFSDEIINKFFDGAVNGAVTNVQGSLIKSDTASYRDYPGRSIQIDYGNGQAVIEMKFYLVKNRAYILQVISPFTNPENKSSQRFFNSFALLNK